MKLHLILGCVILLLGVGCIFATTKAKTELAQVAQAMEDGTISVFDSFSSSN